jgi:hypothetical protein
LAPWEDSLKIPEFLRALVFIFFSSVATGALAVDLRQALQNNDFSTIETQLTAAESAFEHGRLGEYDLLDLYKAFYEREDTLSTSLDRWVRDRPNSYIARLVRGTYRRKLGEFRRGTAYIGHVPQANARYMEQQFELAQTDLREALRLHPRSYIALLNLMNVAMYENDEGQAERLLTTANTLYAGNQLVRARYMVHLEPRWGGSYAQMEQFIERSRGDGVPRPILDLLSAITLCESARVPWRPVGLSQAGMAACSARCR